MFRQLGEGTLAKYHEKYLWPMFEKQKKKKGGFQKFVAFITWVREKYSTELDLRNLLGLKEGRIADIPRLAREYSEKNPLPPDRVWATTKETLWWKCSKKGCDHEWQAPGDKRRGGRRCPGCTGRAATSRNNLLVTHPELAKEYSKRNPLPAHKVIAGSNKMFWWKCSKRKCGWEWQATGSKRKRGTGCPAHDGKVATPWNNLAVTHPELAREYSSRNEKPATAYVAHTNKKLWWKCSKRKCSYEWESTGNYRIRYPICPACRRRRKEEKQKFKQAA